MDYMVEIQDKFAGQYKTIQEVVKDFASEVYFGFQCYVYVWDNKKNKYVNYYAQNNHGICTIMVMSRENYDHYCKLFGVENRLLKT